MNYNTQHFIDKFEKIDEALWNIGAYHSDDKTKSCALGHCDGCSNISEPQRECKSLWDLFCAHKLNVTDINDGMSSRYMQPTPKQRILAALYDIKKMQEPIKEVRTVTKYVAISEKLTSSVKDMVGQGIIKQ